MKHAFALFLASAALGACSMLPGDGSQGNSGRQAMRPAQPAYVPTAETRQCLSQLGAAEASFAPLPDKFYGGGCSTVNTVQLSALYRDDRRQLGLGNLGPVACPVANSFAGWARYGVDRAARTILGSPLARIETFGSYSCRNVAGTSRRSAHSTANAIDVSGFVLEDGRRISVKQGWSGGTPAEQEFLRVVHTSACKRFGTVLGPDYNQAHKDHLHLEGGGRPYCR